MAKMGRPKSDNPKRNKVIVRFTDAEYQKLMDCAKRDNLTITETVRRGVKDILDSKP